MFALVGFLAQIVDGAMGMAYGVTATTFLLSTGVSPAAASASIHVAEIFTTGTSGFSHFKLGNVNRRLVIALLVPCAWRCDRRVYPPASDGHYQAGGVGVSPGDGPPDLPPGISQVQPAGKPRTQADLAGARRRLLRRDRRRGLGPIVTSTLVANGHEPRFTIGSVNATEFFVTTAQAITFIVTIGTVVAQHWPVILGLLVGGVIAAPLAAVVCKRLPPKALMIMVGTLIILLSIRTIVQTFAG